MAGVRPALVLAVVLLAGCSGVAGPGGAPEETPTVTPAPVPDSDARFAPGVTAGGMNVSTVLDAHQERLRNRSHTVTRTLAVRNRSTDAVQWRERERARVAADGSRYVLTTNYSEPRPFDGLVRSTLYYDGIAVRRSSYANGTTATETFGRQTSVDLTNAGLLRRILFQLTEVQVRSGAGDATLVAGTVPYPRILPRPPNARATGTATASIRITSAGLVERVVVGYDAASGGGPARVRLSATVTNVGATTVSEPSWAGS